MVHDEAFRVQTTHARARIDAFVVQTCPSIRTVRAEHTLRPALVIRITVVILHTSAGTCVVAYITFRVYATRGWIAGIYYFWFTVY